LFWQIGNRINDEILLNKRANYGIQILPTLSAKLMARYDRSFEVKTTESRKYYAQKAAEEFWRIRELRNQIARKSFERKEIAEIQSIQLPKDLKSTFKDPYILDFLNLKNTYLEHDIEFACFLNPSNSRGLKSEL
jgi:predicted nuclease of restriction endonuclease-like (RecB) superfamily